jgi:GT2 family glycosyltransferase
MRPDGDPRASRSDSSLLPGLVSIVIPTKNRPDSLARVLDSARAQDYADVEILVVDDGSQPPVEPGPDVRLIRHESSRGASTSKNDGLDAGRGEFVLFLDDDIEFVDPTTIRRAVELARRQPAAGMIGFRQLKPSGDAQGEQPVDSEVACEAGRFFSYACLGRSAPIRAVGGFPSQFDYYYEENELGMRLLEASSSILYDPSLAVIHHQDFRGRDWVRIYRLNFRNACYAAVLRYPGWLVPPVMARYLSQYFRLARSQGRTFDLTGAAGVLGEVFRALPYLLRHRKPVRYATLRRMKSLTRHPAPIS